MRDRHPSVTPPLVPSRSLIFTQRRGTQHQFHFALRDLDDIQFQEVLSEVCLETAIREAAALLVGLPLGLGRGPGREANAGTNHGEVPLPGGRDGDLAGRTLCNSLVI